MSRAVRTPSNTVTTAQMPTEIARMGHQARRVILPMSENMAPSGRIPLGVSGRCSAGA